VDGDRQEEAPLLERHLAQPPPAIRRGRSMTVVLALTVVTGAVAAVLIALLLYLLAGALLLAFLAFRTDG
jgi:hypothetical protein